MRHFCLIIILQLEFKEIDRTQEISTATWVAYYCSSTDICQHNKDPDTFIWKFIQKSIILITMYVYQRIIQLILSYYNITLYIYFLQLICLTSERFI